MKQFAIMAAIVAVALSGCLADGTNSTAITSQGETSGTKTATLECDEKGRLDWGIQGQGEVRITVTDGEGSRIYDDNFDGQGQGAHDGALSGTPGTWTLRATFSGPSGFGQFGESKFQGQWAIVMYC